MKRLLVASLLVVLFTPFASAETYRISGKATYGDGSPVSLNSSILNVK